MKVCNYKDVQLNEVGEEGAEGVSIRVAISKDDGAPNFAMRVFDVQPGGNTPLHRHAWEHEVFILEGKAVISTESGDKSAPAGTIVFVAPDELHQFRNETDEVMRFICLIPNPE
jgi:quercetin dioxygenase-like cupin family protein